MPETISCDVYCTSDKSGKPAIIQINRQGAPNNRLTVVIPKGHRNMLFYEGDVVQCLQGSVYVHVMPGTRATGFHLKEQIAPVSDGMRLDTAVIKIAVLKNVAERGSISVQKDIGTVLTAPGATTR